MLPAATSAFLTMSSVITLPYTIKGITKNIKNEAHANLIALSNVNIHIIGDNIFIILNVIIIEITIGIPISSISDFIQFMFFLSCANLASVGIPGGNLLVMVSLLGKYLNFSIPMVEIFIVMYLLQDCLITTVNVLGNGAIAILLNKSFKQKSLLEMSQNKPF